MREPDNAQTRGFARILHATDFAGPSELAFDHALRLALASRGHLYLVHADRPDPSGDADWSAFPGIRSTLARWGLLPADAPASDVADRLGVRASKAEIGAPDAAEGVVRFAAEHLCDLLVLATHAREGFARLLQGSVAETLARRAGLPTLFLPLQARGFVDPVTGTAGLRRILLPGALRRALPAYSNEIIFMLHGTSIASTVTLIDLTGAARNAYSQFFAPFEAFIFAGLIYLAITFALVGLFRIAERRWLAHLQPRKPLRKAA